MEANGSAKPAWQPFSSEWYGGVLTSEQQLNAQAEWKQLNAEGLRLWRPEKPKLRVLGMDGVEELMQAEEERAKKRSASEHGMRAAAMRAEHERLLLAARLRIEAQLRAQAFLDDREAEQENRSRLAIVAADADAASAAEVLQQMTAPTPSRATGGAAVTPEVRDAFKRFDKNRSGKIDYTELHAALRYVGLSFDSDEASRILRRYDDDRSGLLELDEFATLVTDLRELGHNLAQRSNAAELERAAQAYKRVKAIVEKNAIIFNGFRHLRPGEDVATRWSVRRRGRGRRSSSSAPQPPPSRLLPLQVRHAEPAIAAANAKTLDAIAEIIKNNPSLGMEIKGQAAFSSDTAPPQLAEHYGLHMRDDAKALYDHLARNRATACKEAFEQRGIAAARMLVTFASGHVSSGHAAKTDFVPRPMVELARAPASSAPAPADEPPAPVARAPHPTLLDAAPPARPGWWSGRTEGLRPRGTSGLPARRPPPRAQFLTEKST